MSQPLSVIIAAHNAGETLPAQLDALMNQRWVPGSEIIIADNGSTDSTRSIAEAYDFGTIDLRVIDCAEVPGAGYARNRGVDEATNDYIAFCDADDIVAPDWAEHLGRALDSYPAVGGCLDLRTLNPDHVVLSRGELFATDRLPQFDGKFAVFSSCNFGIRRSTFLDLGGFDPAFVRGEDAEFSLRMHEAGLPAHFSPDAVVHYRLRDTPRSIFEQAVGWGDAQEQLRSRLSGDRRVVSQARSWLWLVRRAPLLRQAAGRARWAYVAGIRIGTARAQLRSAWSWARKSKAS